MEKKILAAILSFLIPGLGHFYSRRWARGIIIFFIYSLIAGIISEFSIHLIPSDISDFPFIHIIIGFVVAWDAYKVAPKGHLMVWQTMAVVSFVFLGLVMMSIKSENPILAIILLIAFLFTASIMRAEQLQATAVSSIRNTIAHMGFAPNEVEDITMDVVRILKAGGDYRISGNSPGLLGQMSDAVVSAANWTKFSGAELSSVIKTVLDIRDRKKGQP
jgi:TM2 domain-containing membrane protein YozV